jgi:hypothetical protein
LDGWVLQRGNIEAQPCLHLHILDLKTNRLLDYAFIGRAERG